MHSAFAAQAVQIRFCIFACHKECCKQQVIRTYFLPSLIAACLAVRQRMDQDGHFIFPADVNADDEGNQVFSFKTLDFEGAPVLVAFTSVAEREKEYLLILPLFL
jgi:hypothetical protein